MWANAGKARRLPKKGFSIGFKASKGKAEKVISWTTGTGVIDPTDFEIDGKRYLLELRHSDKLGKLKENELVIWQADS